MEKLVYEIIKTRDYEQFGLHSLQPLKRVKATPELVESVRKTKGNMLQPILVSRKTNCIVDGHRRFQAVVAAQVPLYVRYLSSKEEKMMSLLNSTSRTWTTMNFIDHWARQRKDYHTLKEYIEQKKASIELFKLFAGVSNLMIKNGADVKHINYNKIEAIRKLAELIKGIFSINTTPVLRALYKLSMETPNFSFKRLLNTLINNQKKGKYENIVFVSTQTKLFNILSETYTKG